MKQTGTIIPGVVSSYDTSSGKYYVWPHGSSHNSKKGFPAVLLSSTPFGDGAGMKGVPVQPQGTPCLLFQYGQLYYILGFTSMRGPVLHDSPMPVRPTLEGEMLQHHSSGANTGFNATGSWTAWVGDFVNMVLNPARQQFTMYAKNMFVNWYTGFMSYIYDLAKGTGLFKFQIQKELDLSARDRTSKMKDKVLLQVGALPDEDHMIDFKVSQNYDLTRTADFEITGKLGEQSDGTFLNLHMTKGGTVPTLQYELDANTNGKTKLSLASGTTKTTDLVLEPGGDIPVSIVVNKDKCMITVGADGTVTLKTTDGANILLGGQGKEQQLVTKSFVEQVYMKHMHSNGNQGAPTGTPIAPTPMDIGVDSATGHYTTTTKAE